LLWRDPAPLPTIRPLLPAEVTHVWMMSTWTSGSALYWSEKEGWSLVDKRLP
jgi:hypothetical protein